VTDPHAIVVAYHGSEMLAACLSTLGAGVPVIVVDNSSDPEVAQVARAAGAEYVDPEANLGFAAGVNVGLRRVPDGRDVLLLNPDALLTADSLTALHDRLHAPGSERIGAVSPRLVHPSSGAIERVVWPFPSPARMWLEALGLGRLLPQREGFCVGAVLLLRREALDEVGHLDERFFLYAEETDWQRRARDAGWLSSEVSSVTATHEGAGTSTDLTRRELLFHAGTETYIRKWFGSRGWTTYRAGAALGAAWRGVVLPPTRARAARRRSRLYLSGPRRTAGIAAQSAVVGRRVAHVVVTGAFAGVERYVCEVAREQAARGARVTVIGGDPARMAAELDGVAHRAAPDLPRAVRELISLGRQDVVHVHMTAAELAAVLTAPRNGAPVVATRHFAGVRGSRRASRLLGRAISRRLARQIAISHFVAASTGEPATVIPNGVRTQERDAAPRQRIVLCMQRLEPEKSTDVALRAWAASGLAAQDWELHVAGSGSLRDQLHELADDLGITDSVRWLGQVTDTGDRLVQAGLLLAPAPAEPFGLSIAEAMALATPVVASDAGAHRELLGDDAWLFAPGDVDAAGRALSDAAARSESDRRDYGLALRHRQRTLFDLHSHVSAVDDLYAELSGASRDRRRRNRR
jgi:glycosyltransferase involved in cell wall biosynthesis/GT2 family glycosyltransferase